ncbi:hypothetical protein GQS52_13750 [Streptomyces sp. SCUT-3]|nr:hypothetical protein C0036_27015 [Streptomyces sp. DJ]QMV22662.1 hypothetical protein GQS52_13750 [Streptomyces sp. SCUT-3]
MACMTSDRNLLPSPLPDITRPDAGHVLISHWDTAGPEQQRALMDAVMDAWEEHPLPGDFLSRSCFAGTDGRGVLNYAQWTSAEAHREFAADPANVSSLGRRIGAARDTLVENSAEPDAYRLYRSMLLPADGPGGAGGVDVADGVRGAGGGRPVPGCIVVVAFDTDGHDSARRFVDTLVDRFSGVQPEDGGISSNFHIRTDGGRVLNYSEWTEEKAHQQVVESRLQEDGEVLRLIRAVPGVRPLGFRRYLPHRGLGRRTAGRPPSGAGVG